MSNENKKSKPVDLVDRIPSVNRNDTNEALIRNLYNKFLTKDNSIPLLGYIGDKSDSVLDSYIPQINSDRDINALQPMMHTKHGSDEYAFTFNDAMNRLKLLNVDISDFGEFGKVQSFNLNFPVNLDMFVNFFEYWWIGAMNPSSAPDYNPGFGKPEYIVMSAGHSNSGNWGYDNQWVHVDDLNASGYTTSSDGIIQATRPILEYHQLLELNTNIDLNGKPTKLGEGVLYPQIKTEYGQYPLFNLYQQDQVTHSGKVSPILYYAEDTTSPIDAQLGKRIAIDTYGDFTFSHGLTTTDGELLLYKFMSGVNQYNSCWTKSTIYNPEYVKIVDSEIQPAAISDPEGTWKIPDQLFKNINHITEKTTKYSDLASHMSDIIKNQTGFDGNQLGRNNYRDLPLYDFGKGGLIKDHNSSFDLFMGVINQPDSTPLSIIDFARQQYNQSINFVNEYISQNIADLLNSRTVLVSNSQSENEEKLFNNFLQVLPNKYADNIFADSTAFTGWPATLPYLGLTEGVQPGLVFDKDTGLISIQHHDGHVTRSFIYDETLLSNIANILFLRSDGTSTAGLHSTIPPYNPYAREFWYDVTNNQLRIFNVNSDIFIPNLINPAELPEGPNYPLIDGEYTYDRVNSTLYQWDELNNTFILGGINANAWVILDITGMINNIVILAEQKLYDGIPLADMKIDINSVQQHSRYDELQEIAFAKFAALNDLDLYSPDYMPNNAFTWNYKSVVINNVLPSTARWHNIYKQYFGTSRPNLEPWILSGYTEKPQWWDVEYSDEFNLNTGNRLWSDDMWTDIRNGNAPIGEPLEFPPSGAWPLKFAVDITTDVLLAPYNSTDNEALLSIIPDDISDGYIFNDEGPSELEWKKSIFYQYDIAKTAFIIDPINFINDTWGSNFRILDDYEFDGLYSKKVQHNTLVLHGDIVSDSSFDIENIVMFNTNYQEYTIEISSFYQNNTIFKISSTAQGVMNSGVIGTTYTTPDIEFLITTNQANDLHIGDKFIVNYSINGLDVSKFPASTKNMNGLSQWFVNLSRFNSVDTNISLNNNILRDWEIQLGYRTSGLIDGTNLKIQTDSANLTNGTDTNVIVKRNKGILDTWLNAFRIQLVRKGTVVHKSEYLGIPSPGNTNVPFNKAEDWEYRIEISNSQNPVVEYYDLDTNGKRQSFSVLGRENTIDDWDRLLDKTSLQKQVMPFVVKGLQNVVNFLYGYLLKLEEDGWAFNKSKVPTYTDTGRLKDWQFEIENFIDVQYLGVDAGSSVLLNPFVNSVWYNTPRGMVAPLENTLYNDPYITQTVFNAIGKNITKEKLKVLRQDDVTRISTAVPMSGVHLVVDEHEHVILFTNYVKGVSNLHLIYDPYLGIRVNRINISTTSQHDFDGKLTFDGHYILNGEVKKNVEGIVQQHGNLYDTNKMQGTSQATQAARVLLGYEPNECMEKLGVSDTSAFSYWRGLLGNKGSNLSIDAFLNSVRFKSASLDEYWAYKVADYGDARFHSYPEIKLDSSETAQKYLSLQFLDSNEEPDIGFIGINPLDEERWFTLSDVSTDLYFDAELLDIQLLDPISIPGYFNIKQRKDRKPDLIKLFSALQDVYVPADKYEQINYSTIKVLVDISEFGNIEARMFGPSSPKFNPSKLIDYQNQVIVKELPLWDPARGSHSSTGSSIIDMRTNKDPAKYNFSTRTSGNTNYATLNHWSSNERGIVWWNTKNLDYVPYSDTKIFPNLNDRLTYWGALAQYGSVDLYEWTESTVHPSEWSILVEDQEGDADIDVNDKASGEASLRELYSRTRTWQSRPVPWKYANVPGISGTFVIENNTNNITVGTTSIGIYDVILDDVKWSDLGYNKGMKISAWDSINEIPTGEAIILSDSESIIFDDNVYIGTNFDLTLTKSLLSEPNVIGVIDIVNDPENVGSLRVSAISDIIVKQSLEITTNLNYDFDEIGVRINSIFKPSVDLNIINESFLYVSGFASVIETPDGSITSFTITKTPTGNITVSVDGVPQTDIVDYIISGNNITFTIAPSLGISPEQFSIIYKDNIVETVNTVSTVFTTSSSLISNYFNIIVDDVVLGSSEYSITNNSIVNTITLNVAPTKSLEINHSNDFVPQNGSILDFVLNRKPSTILPIVDPIVNVGNVLQISGDDYTIVDETISFVVPPTSIINVIFNSDHLINPKELILDMVNLVGTLRSSISINVINNMPSIITDWIAWNDPEPEELSSDLESPDNRWEAITSAQFQDVQNTAYVLSEMQSSIDAPFITSNGTIIENYRYVWTDWNLEEDSSTDFVYLNNLPSATFTSAIEDPDLLTEVYRNGFLEQDSLYTINGIDVDVTNIQPNEGDIFHIINKVYIPTDDDLAFDPEISEDPTKLKQYKYDYQYTTVEVQEENGIPAKTLYYFWVSNKNVIVRKREISLKQAQLNLEFLNTPYAVLQNIKDNLGKPVRYNQFISSGLNRFVTRDGTYKLRFTRDFILREDPRDIDLKNIHEEWVLMRQNQKIKIPSTLWDRLVDSVCESDLVGNPVPSFERREYDNRFDTSTRYGPEKGQTLVDSDLAKASIIYTILNTQLRIDNESVGIVNQPDIIQFLDFNESNTWFVDSTTSRTILTQIWDSAKPEQINEIFFAVFFDALSKNYEFVDIIKTSFISVHSIRLFQT